MIINRTPYKGKIKIKLEKYPEYSGRDILNKIHFDFGFIKIVSRMKPNINKDGFEIDKNKVNLIEEYTGGIIKDHKIDQDKEDFILKNSFIHPNGTYIGDIRDGWWYYNNKFILTNKYPHGVALKTKSRSSICLKNNLKNPIDLMIKHHIKNDNVEGFYGYTHRGGQLFRIGDKLFDPKWSPNWEDLKIEWIKLYCQSCGYSKIPDTIEEAKTYVKLQDLKKDIRVVDFIPFKFRGSKTIDTWEEAEEAAINMSKYLN